MMEILSILAQVERSMKSTACVRILKLQVRDSRFKLFCSCILIMGKLQANRKLCQKESWLVFYGITLIKNNNNKLYSCLMDKYLLKELLRLLFLKQICKTKKSRMLNVLLLLFQKIIK